MFPFISPVPSSNFPKSALFSWVSDVNVCEEAAKSKAERIVQAFYFLFQVMKIDENSKW